MRSKARLEQEIKKVKEGLTAEQQVRFDRAIELARTAMEAEQWYDELDDDEQANLTEDDDWLSEAERHELWALVQEFGGHVLERCVDPDPGPHDPENPLIPEPLRKYYWRIDSRIHRLAIWKSYNETTDEENEELEDLQKQSERIYNGYFFPEFQLISYSRANRNGKRVKIPPEKKNQYEKLRNELEFFSEKMMNKTASESDLEMLLEKFDEKSDFLRKYTISESDGVQEPD